MCLYQTREDRTDDTGGLCVRQMTFVLADSIIGTFEANGIFGLAPGSNEQSYIDQMYSQGQVANLKVGLNYEDPADDFAISTITFGDWDLNQVD